MQRSILLMLAASGHLRYLGSHNGRLGVVQ